MIKELVEKAKIAVPTGLTPEDWIDRYNEILVGLVVQECIDNLYWHGHDSAASQLEWLRGNRFGVKNGECKEG